MAGASAQLGDAKAAAREAAGSRQGLPQARVHSWFLEKLLEDLEGYKDRSQRGEVWGRGGQRITLTLGSVWSKLLPL